MLLAIILSKKYVLPKRVTNFLEQQDKRVEYRE
jgi:hypothetical protein